MPDTVAALVDTRRDDDHTGLLFEGSSWTWREVVAECHARAALLARLREPGPFHVGVLLENVPGYVFLLGGAALAGATVVGINPTRRGAELARDVRHTDCQLVVTSRDQLSLLEGLDLGVRPDRVLLVDDLPLVEATPDGAPGADVAPESLYLLIFTSGSTGTPKAVRMTQGRAARAAERTGFGPDDVLYCAMPLFHGHALAASVFPAFQSGATLLLRRRFSASGFLPDVRTHGATFFSTVGRALAHILATPPTAHDRDHNLKVVLAPESSRARHRRVLGPFRGPCHRGVRVERERGDPHAGSRHPGGFPRQTARRERRRRRRFRDRRGVCRGAFRRRRPARQPDRGDR